MLFLDSGFYWTFSCSTWASS